MLLQKWLAPRTKRQSAFRISVGATQPLVGYVPGAKPFQHSQWLAQHQCLGIFGPGKTTQIDRNTPLLRSDHGGPPQSSHVLLHKLGFLLVIINYVSRFKLLAHPIPVLFHCDPILREYVTFLLVSRSLFLRVPSKRRVHIYIYIYSTCVFSPRSTSTRRTSSGTWP